MAITSYQVISEVPNGDQLSMIYEFTHHTGKIDTVRRRVPAGTDHDAYMQSLIPGLEQKAADEEVALAFSKTDSRQSPEQVAEYQDQATFDAKVIARCMTLVDPITFRHTLDFYEAVRSRGGNNDNQRADYLAMTSEMYGEIADRYNTLYGVLNWLDADVAWPEIPDGFE